MRKAVKLKTALLLAAAVNLSYAEAGCFPPAKGQTPYDVLECLQSRLDSQQKRMAELEKENKALQNAVKGCIVQKKGGPNLQGTVYYDKAARRNNKTNYSEFTTVVTRKVTLSAPANVTIIGHGYGKMTQPGGSLDAAIFVDGATMYKRGGWGMGRTHSKGLNPIITVAAAKLAAGTHTIELKYYAQNGKGTVYFRAPMMITMLNCSR